MSKVAQLRKSAIAERKAQLVRLGSLEWDQLSQKVIQKFLSSLPSGWSWASKKVALYVSRSEELCLDALVTVLSRSGARLYFPVVEDANGKMSFYEVTNPLDPKAWATGIFGILEPVSRESMLKPQDLDWIFVPGVLFSENGERIGMGKGFYDRALKDCKKTHKIALAFDFQVQKTLPQESWDQKLDHIVTEKRDIRRPGLKGL